MIEMLFNKMSKKPQSYFIPHEKYQFIIYFVSC